jgi:hypothetical protein
MRGERHTATRVFPGDEPPRAKGVVSDDRRPSLERYEFTNAYGPYFILLTSSWDSLPIIQSYVKQKLGETPEPTPKEDTKSKVESPTTPTIPKRVLAVSTMTSATEGERWDPNKQLDKLKSGVITKLREQQQKRSPTTTNATPNSTTEPTTEEQPPPKITVDEGTNP